MPALNSYAFDNLVHIAHGAREAFRAAALRPEADVEAYAGTTVTEAFACTKAAPEKLAKLTDAYLTALSVVSHPPFNGAFDRGRKPIGRANRVDGLVIMAALGHRPDPRSGTYYNEAAYK